MSISTFIYPFFAKSILKKQYLNNDWLQIDQYLTTSGEYSLKGLPKYKLYKNIC
ncbi:MAG: hypothetical protein ACKVKE_01235 [Candidatus Pelagibacterales bacterium]